MEVPGSVPNTAMAFQEEGLYTASVAAILFVKKISYYIFAIFLSVSLFSGRMIWI
jgi:hypothetical protein